MSQQSLILFLTFMIFFATLSDSAAGPGAGIDTFPLTGNTMGTSAGGSRSSSPTSGSNASPRFPYPPGMFESSPGQITIQQASHAVPAEVVPPITRSDLEDGLIRYNGGDMVKIRPEMSIAEALGEGWWIEGVLPPRNPTGVLTLGIEKIQWKTEPWDDPPIALKLNPPPRKNKANIMLSREAVEAKLNTVFKHAKSSMDDVHLWMKVGTGFQPNDLWLRIEFARPPGGFFGEN